MAIGERFKSAWNAFRNKDPSPFVTLDGPATYHGISYGPDSMPRRFLRSGADKSIIVAIFQRLATDAALVPIKHVRVNENDGYVETISSGLNYILNCEANIDQTAREFIEDIVLTMFDGKGVAACVPIDTNLDPTLGSFDIRTMRVGTVVDWLPQYVNVEVYNEFSGMREQIWLPKSIVGLVVNPFRDVINEPNGTLQRLLRTLGQMDSVNERTASGKMDLIIQLPYVIKSEARKQEADKRLKSIVDQLAESEYGIAYTDGTEKIVQLNRSIESNIDAQAEKLTNQLYTQLGLTPEIMNGTANEATMINYYQRTINPILNAIVDEFERKFLTKTARSQRQAIRYYRDPFTLTTSEQIAEIADKFTRNAILSSNEMRSVIGFQPVADERANELRNKNLNVTDQEAANPILVDNKMSSETGGMTEIQNEGEMP